MELTHPYLDRRYLHPAVVQQVPASKGPAWWSPAQPRHTVHTRPGHAQRPGGSRPQNFPSPRALNTRTYLILSRTMMITRTNVGGCRQGTIESIAGELEPRRVPACSLFGGSLSSSALTSLMRLPLLLRCLCVHDILQSHPPPPSLESQETDLTRAQRRCSSTCMRLQLAGLLLAQAA